MEETDDQANPAAPACDQAKEMDGTSEEASLLLDGDEANANNKLTDLKEELE